MWIGKSSQKPLENFTKTNTSMLVGIFPFIKVAYHFLKLLTEQRYKHPKCFHRGWGKWDHSTKPKQAKTELTKKWKLSDGYKVVFVSTHKPHPWLNNQLLRQKLKKKFTFMVKLKRNPHERKVKLIHSPSFLSHY